MRSQLGRRWLVSTLFALLVATLGPPTSSARAEASTNPAHADSAARSAFEAGRQAYDRGAFEEALAHFEQAHALSPRAELLYNIGRAADSDGQSARAIAAYSSYLDAFPNAENRDFVRARLEKMRALEGLRSSSPRQASPLPTVAAAMSAETGVPAATKLNFGSIPVREDEPTRPFWKRVWFWSVVGAVVVGGVTAGVIGAARHRDPRRAAADAYVVTPEIP